MVQQVVKGSGHENQPVEACPHHWIIDTPTGPISMGTCRICGKQREFKNYIEIVVWSDDNGPD